ncbi:MAG: hydantoinase/oxoprolinase family protein [Solirubrobacteraceae bacterium]
MSQLGGATRVGVDVGGTFTDLVALVDGEVRTAKVPSTPNDQSGGVMRAIRASQIEPADVAALANGTTVATNALLERRGARIALVTTHGFRDILEIARQDRPSLYDLTRSRPPALVPRELRFCVRERMGPAGELLPLDEASVGLVIDELRATAVEAVAVCLLFAFRHPEHERAVGEALRESLPGVHVSLASEVLPEFREYERFATTCADAYLAPRLGEYLRNLATRIERASMPAPLVMQSSGGVMELEAATHKAAACVLSGPAGGVVGAAYAACASGFQDVLSFDMGGTSTDVAPILDGRAQTTTESRIAGIPIKLPMVDVHTVSAGGGSIAWADPGGALRVGPRSAGAEPGPAAYGRGGTEPTVTDANLLLGYLEADACLGGELVLRRDLSARCLEVLGGQLGLDALGAALGIVRVAEAEMVRALRVISVERGLDPREFALVAFGGAGGMHACALAEELGMETVLGPKAGGVLSALGLAISDLRHDSVQPYHALLDGAQIDQLEQAFAEMEAAAGEGLDGPRFERRADLRYRMQSYELTVDADRLGALEDRFGVAHERRYGYRVAAEPIELVNLRLLTTIAVDKPALHEAPDDPRKPSITGRRRVNFDRDWKEVDVFDRRAMGAGAEVCGPAIVEFPEATWVLRDGWGGAIDDVGTLVLHRTEQG